jgi:hypothetical protein
MVNIYHTYPISVALSQINIDFREDQE